MLYAYCRASTSRKIASPEAQRQIIESYCTQHGCTVDAWYVDAATAGKKELIDREAGAALMRVIRRGDHVIVASLDRIAQSFHDFARLVETLANLGITLHIIDLGGVLDLGTTAGAQVAYIVSALAGCERRLASSRITEGHAVAMAEGRRHSHVAPFGSKFQRCGGVTRVVPADREQAVIRKVAELRALGHSFDEIRQIFAYTLKLKNRRGHPFGLTEIQRMAARGAGLPATAETREARDE